MYVHMNDARMNIGSRGQATPAVSGVKVLYDLPAQQVGAMGQGLPPTQVSSVKDALDRVHRATDELSLPVYEPESLKRGIMPYPTGWMPVPGSGRDALVVPGRPIPRFRFPIEGR